MSRFGVAGLAMIAATLFAVVAGCAVTYPDTPVPSPSSLAAGAPTDDDDGPGGNCSDPLASYAPERPMPTPGQMPAGSTMRTIQERGRLIAGVSADTYLLGSRDPISGQIEGFDIDMVKMVAKAIFGNENAYELRVITAAQRVSVLQRHQVDIVARAMTITCGRWDQIAFSSEYYRSGQKLLIRRGEKIRGVQDLAGKRVCAPEGTSTITTIAKVAPAAIIVPAETHTGCLVLFQQEKVEAITGDDTVLAGLAAQDPYAQVLSGKSFTAEPYGIGVAADQVDLVRFINGALEQMRTDGQWTTAYDRWLAPSLGKAPKPPRPVYGRQP